MDGSGSIFHPVVEDEEANWWMTQLFTLVAGLGCGMIAHLLSKHFWGQATPTRFISFFTYVLNQSNIISLRAIYIIILIK